MKASWNLRKGAAIAEGRTVIEPLGGGRRYEVLLVWDDGIHAEAVAKVLRPDRMNDDGAVKALRREAELLERLHHRVLVRGLGSALDGSFPHLLVEYVDGENLRDVLGEHPAIAAGDALSLALDLLEAVDYLAESGVAHLDVKPSNVMLGDPVCLLDLGAARTFEELATRRTPIGTAAYMAPEQCDPGSVLAGIGPPADIWGVGATLYHALTGLRPFSRPGPRGSDLVVRYPQLVEDPLPIPAYVSASVAGLVTAMLEREPRDRPTAREALETLRPLPDELAGH